MLNGRAKSAFSLMGVLLSGAAAAVVWLGAVRGDDQRASDQTYELSKRVGELERVQAGISIEVRDLRERIALMEGQQGRADHSPLDTAGRSGHGGVDDRTLRSACLAMGMREEVADGVTREASRLGVGERAILMALRAREEALSDPDGVGPACLEFRTLGPTGVRAVVALLRAGGEGCDLVNLFALFEGSWPPGSEGTIMQAADDETLPVWSRRSLVLGLGYAKTDEVREHVYAMAMRERNDTLCTAVIDALVSLEDPRVTSACEHMLESENMESIRPLLYIRLGQIGGVDSKRILMENLLSNPKGGAVGVGIVALWGIDKESARSVARTILDSGQAEGMAREDLEILRRMGN